MNKMLVTSLVSMAIVLLPKAVSASGSTTQTVAGIRVSSDGRALVFFANPLGGTQPSCATTYHNALAFDTNTAGGKAVLALVTGAMLSGRTLTAYGANQCNVFVNGPWYTEDWYFGDVGP